MAAGIDQQSRHPTTQESNSVSNISSGVSSTQHAQHQPHNYRVMVREELLEIEEQRKIRFSLVIRGLRASSATEATAKFAENTQALIGENVDLYETCRIKNDADLYRGNVHKIRQRRLILEQVKNLKDSPNFHVYIKRDLSNACSSRPGTSSAKQDTRATAHHLPQESIDQKRFPFPQSLTRLWVGAARERATLTTGEGDLARSPVRFQKTRVTRLPLQQLMNHR